MIRGIKGYVLYGLGFFIVLELMLFAAIYYWPTFIENFSAISKLASPIPMLRDLAGVVKDEGIPAYVIGQHYFKGCSALGTTACVLFAASAIAGEAHRGTMEIWLSRPISRTRLMTERWLGGLIAVVLPVFISSYTIPYQLEMVNETMQWDDITRCSIHMCVFLAPIYAFTFAWSALGSEPLRISFVMLFVSILTFALYLVESATDYSLFRIVDVRVFLEILKTKSFDWRMEGPLLAATGILYIVALKAFQRRTP